MTLGAAWNLTLETPPSDQDVSEILDRDGREAFRKAIEKDRGVADAIIQDAKDKADGGIISEIGIATGPEAEPLTVQVEREATRRMAVKRAAAQLTSQRVLPEFQPRIRDAVVFEPAAGGRLKPTVLYEVIQTSGNYRVIRRMGRYYIQTIGGRTLATDDTLGVALLILLALLERERRKRGEKNSLR